MSSWKMVIIKWIKAILIKPLTILKSVYFRLFSNNEELAQKRLKICNSCSQKLNIKFVGDICGECGCILDNKTRLIDEHCDLCKW